MYFHNYYLRKIFGGEIALIAILILMTAGQMFGRSYYDSAILYLSNIFLSLIWCIFTIGFALANLIKIVNIWPKKSEQTRWMIPLLIIFGVVAYMAALILLTDVPKSVQDLLKGPIPNSGTVERTSVQSSNGAISYFLDIDGVTYSATRTVWYRSLEEGDEVDFVHTRRGLLDTVAFHPNNLQLTPIGVLLISASAYLWVFTLVLSLRIIHSKSIEPYIIV